MGFVVGLPPRESNREGLIVHVGCDFPYLAFRSHYRMSIAEAFVKTAQINHVLAEGRMRHWAEARRNTSRFLVQTPPDHSREPLE